MRYKCPQCESQQLRKDGKKYIIIEGERIGKQRWQCKDCFYKTIYPMNANDKELIQANDKCEKLKQGAMDRLRIHKKYNRVSDRIENAINVYSKDILDILTTKNFSSIVKVHKEVDGTPIGVVQVSDTHFNELILIEGNKYDFHIAAKRLQLFAYEVKQYLLAIGVTKIVVAFTGDLMNSDRRLDELLSESTNRAKATFISVDILKAFLLDLNTVFNIDVVYVTGNESRAKDELGWCDALTTDNYDFTIFQILKYTMKGSPGMVFHEGDPTEQVVSVNNHNILILHGTKMGSAVEKQTQLLKGKYASKGIIIHYVIFGHLHSARIGDTYARSSSLCGGNEYSDKGLGLDSRASQNVYVFYKNGRHNGLKIDLQLVDGVEGYNVQDAVNCYNAKSASKLKTNKTIIEITI